MVVVFIEYLDIRWLRRVVETKSEEKVTGW
jgi:hypothetical protein